jgi:copper transport protein
VAVLLGGFAIAHSQAEAHGVQVSSSPAPNSQAGQSPGEITVTFSEKIEPSVTTIQLWDQSAKQVTLPAPTFDSASTTMTVAVPDKLAPGIYTVIWRNLSSVDGHTWAGSFPFTMLGPNGEVPAGSVPASLQDLAKLPSNGPSSLDSAARWIVLLGSAVMLGGAAYVMFIVRPSTRRLSPESGALLRNLSRTILITTTLIAIFFVLQGSLLQLISQADKLGGLGKTDDLLRDTRSGHYLIARQGLLLVALLSVLFVSRVQNGRAQIVGLSALLLSSVGVLLTLSLVSHAAASDGSFWTTTVDVLHLLAASIWIGMLVHIGLSMPRWLGELKGVPRTLFAAESFRRFSFVAATSVAVLLTSGVVSALVQFTSWSELWDTSYGLSLIAKMSLMMPLLAVAGLNAFYLGRRVEVAGLQLAGGADDDAEPALQPVERLQRVLANTVRVEAVLAIAVLVSVAVLTQLEPPRAAAQAQDLRAAAPATSPTKTDLGYIQRNAEVEGLIMVLRITPGKVGQNTFEVGLGSEFGSVGEVQDVRLDFTNKTASTGQSRLDLPLAGSARFEATAANLSLPGDWTVTAIVRRRGVDDVTTTFDVPIAKVGASPSSDSIWDWPLHGARSYGAIVAIVLGMLATLGVGGWQYRELREAR